MLAWCWFGLAVARLAYQIYRDNKTKQKILSLVFFVCHLNLSFFQLLTRIVLITHPFEQ
ncbi:hypothetical protein AWA2013_32660 (plasmid) [Lactiplantibacillus plantarum]|jgi:hypothetical protein|nr:hypothetical protein AWA2013_32660 [Lactiplantibacillus plantarum]